MLDVEVAIVSPMRMDANAATFLAAVVVCATTYTIWKMNCAIQAIGSTSRSTINWICSIATPVMVRMMRRRRTGMRRRRRSDTHNKSLQSIKRGECKVSIYPLWGLTVNIFFFS